MINAKWVRIPVLNGILTHLAFYIFMFYCTMGRMNAGEGKPTSL